MNDVKTADTLAGGGISAAPKPAPVVPAAPAAKPASTAEQQSTLSSKLAANGAAMVPLAFKQQLHEWVKANAVSFQKVIMAAEPEQKRLIELICASVLYHIKSNEKLLQCSINSVGESLFYCAAMGLMPGPLGEVALIPYKNEAKVMPTYFGLTKLAYNTGMVRRIAADVICANDEFEYSTGLAPVLRHSPYLKGNRGEMFAAWSLVETVDGSPFVCVKEKDFIEGIRKRSPSVRANQSSPWDTDYNAMTVKTVVKQVLKLFPKSVVDVRAQRKQTQLALAMDFDNHLEDETKSILPIQDVIEVLGDKS